MNAATAVSELSQDYLLLVSIVEGIGAHRHKHLSRLLCDVILCLMQTPNVVPAASESRRCGCSEQSPQENCRLACNLLGMLVVLERRRALNQQSNLHTFMRGNSTVPLLFDALGRHFIHPLLVDAIDDLLSSSLEDGGDVAEAVENVLCIDRFSPPGDECAVVSEVDIDSDLERVGALVNKLWSVVEESVDSWPLPLRWALASLARSCEHVGAGGAESSWEGHWEDIVPMLSTMVVLRVVSPCIVGCSQRRAGLEENFVTDDRVAFRKRVMFITKLLQRAAYHVWDTRESTGDEGPLNASSAVKPIVEALHCRIVGLWALLADHSALLAGFRRETEQGELQCPWTGDPPPRKRREAPISGSPLRNNAAGSGCEAVAELSVFLDCHITAIVASMNSSAPIGAPVHLFRVQHFTQYANRRIERRTTGEDHDPVDTAPDEVASHAKPNPASHIALIAQSSFQTLKNKFSRDRSHSLTAPSPPSPGVSGEPSREDLFEELVRHSARCRIQPDTLKYAHQFCLFLGNVQTVSALKERDVAESSSFLGPPSGNEETPIEPERVACAILLLYADQLTEACHNFALAKERNSSILAKSIPLSARYCQRHAPSLLCDGSLDAAAHLCYQLDAVEQSRGSCSSVQLVFFPPQEPHKCGCGKEWIRAVLQLLLPRRIIRMVSQVIFSQPVAGGSSNTLFRSLGILSSGRSTSSATGMSTQQLFAHDTIIPLITPSTTSGGGAAKERKLTGVKSQSVLAAIERVLLGTPEICDEVNSTLPSAYLSARSAPSHRAARMPLALRDYLLLKGEVAEQNTAESATPPSRSRRNSFSRSAIASSRSIGGADERAVFPDEIPSPSPLPALLRSPPPLECDSDADGPGEAGDAPIVFAEDVWEVGVQRQVLELVWSVTALSQIDHVSAIGIPHSVLTSFRAKVMEWFCEFHVDLVDNLVCSSLSAASLPSRRDSGVACSPAPKSSLRRVHSVMSPSSQVSPPSRPATTASSKVGIGKSSQLHCTWFGFLTERLSPVEMAEFEAACYQAITESYNARSATRAASQAVTDSWLFVDSKDPSRSGGLLSMCSVSLQHVSLRSLWRMLLYSVSRLCGALLSSEDPSASTPLWRRWCGVVEEVSKSFTDDPQQTKFTAGSASEGSTPLGCSVQEGTEQPQEAFRYAVALGIVQATHGAGACAFEVLVLVVQCSLLVRDVCEAPDGALRAGVGRILTAFAPECCSHYSTLPTCAAEDGQRTIDAIADAISKFGSTALHNFSLGARYGEAMDAGRAIAPRTCRSWLSGMPDELMVAQMPL